MSKYRIAFLIWLTVMTVVAATVTTIYAPRNLLLIGGHIVDDLVDALPHRVEIERCYAGLLLIGRRGGWCG